MFLSSSFFLFVCDDDENDGADRGDDGYGKELKGGKKRKAKQRLSDWLVQILLFLFSFYYSSATLQNVYSFN